MRATKTPESAAWANKVRSVFLAWLAFGNYLNSIGGWVLMNQTGCA